MYERLRAEWKVDDKFEGHSEINAVLLDKTESKFAKPTGSLEVRLSPFCSRYRIKPELHFSMGSKCPRTCLT